MALIHLNFFSESLKKNTEVNVIIPAEMDIKKKDYQVIYLLHGTFGNYSDWVRYSNIKRYAKECDMVVVMPSGDNSFYLNYYSGPQYATYIAEELYHYIPNIFPVTKDRSKTYIGGISMGGYGAFYLAITHPEQYGAAVSLCGGFNIVKIMENSSFSSKDYAFEAMFQNYTPERWKEKDVNLEKLFIDAKKHGVKIPELFLAVGTEDITYDVNQDLIKVFEENEILFHYEERSGGHDWNYWDYEIRKALLWLKERKTEKQTQGYHETAILSEKAKLIYREKLNKRVLYPDYKCRDNKAATRKNSEIIRNSANLQDVLIRKFTEKDVKLEEIIVPGAEEDKYILYIHGGGFVFGEPAWGYFYAVEVARNCHRRILAVDYKLAPEHPFPEGVEDCIRGYQWLLEKGIKAENIVFLGESSGGNLVLSLTVACKQRNLPMASAICSISPVVDVTFPFSSYKERDERECVLPKNQAEDVKENYLKDNVGENPLASPYRADLTGFPPTYHIVSTEEMLFDDSVHMHEKLLQSGVNAKLKVWEGMWHTFCMEDYPESWEVISDISEFFNSI